MSFVHHTLIGHFDPRRVDRDLTVSRRIDASQVARLLGEYPAGVDDLVFAHDGYLRCQWATAGGLSELVRDFAYRLAAEEGCLADENMRVVGFPPQAAAAQQAAWQGL